MVGYPGLVLNNRFELIEVIGEGGMSVVFKAKDLRQAEMGEAEPFIAVKILRTALQNDPRFFTLLAQEAKKSQELSHPHIVNVFDFDRFEDITYMTMELLKGESLEQLLQRKALPASLAAKQTLALQIIDAVIHAHQHSVIHADLKPSNIFIETAKPGARDVLPLIKAKVFDFGIARALHQTQQNIIGFSPAYATPATVQGAIPSPYDDAYGLGCILYALFAGHHPYQKRSSQTIVQASRDLQRLNQLNHEQWQALKQLLLFPYYPADFDLNKEQLAAPIASVSQRQVLTWLFALRTSFMPQKSSWFPRASGFGLVLVIVMLGIWVWSKPARLEAQMRTFIEQEQWQAALSFIDDHRSKTQRLPVSEPLTFALIERIMAQINLGLTPGPTYDPQASADLLNAALTTFNDSVQLAKLSAQFEHILTQNREQLQLQLHTAIERADFCFTVASKCQTGVVYFAELLRKAHPADYKLLRPSLLQGFLSGYALTLYNQQAMQAQRIYKDALSFFAEPDLIALGMGQEYKPLGTKPLQSSQQQLQTLKPLNLSPLAQTLESWLTLGLAEEPLPVTSRAAVQQIYGYLVALQAFTPYKNPVWRAATLPPEFQTFFNHQGVDVRASAAVSRAQQQGATKLKKPDVCARHSNSSMLQANQSASLSRGLGDCQDVFTQGQGPLLTAVWLADPALGQAYGLAVSRFELAWQDMQQFCALNVCNQPQDVPLDGPVYQISEELLDAYLLWLNQHTGYKYRLLRLPEWQVLADPLGLMSNLIAGTQAVQANTCEAMGYVSSGEALARTSVFQGRNNRYGVYNLTDLSPEIVVSGANYILVPGRQERFRRCRIAAPAYEYPYAAYRLARLINF